MSSVAQSQARRLEARAVAELSRETRPSAVVPGPPLHFVGNLLLTSHQRRYRRSRTV